MNHMNLLNMFEPNYYKLLSFLEAASPQPPPPHISGENLRCGPMKQLKAMMKRINQDAWKNTQNIHV